MEKTIEQIKEEYSSERGYTSWRNLTWDSDVVSINKDVDVIALRYAINYATQLQPNIDLITTEICVLRERVAELEGGLKDCAWTLQRVLDTTKPDSDWATFTTSIVDIISLAESLINKGKDNGI